jgi:hypothetical protein
MWTGNRGVLHDEGRTVVRAWQVRRWITCRLEFRGRHREVMTARRWTELFFLDEATAFAAGHRPCGECRNADYRRFRDLWSRVHPEDPAGADPMDDRLHAERLSALHPPVGGGVGWGRRSGKRTVETDLDDLPDGAFVTRDGRALLVMDRDLLEWTPAGYAGRLPRPVGVRVDVLTPSSVVAVIRAGYRPQVHPTAEA